MKNDNYCNQRLKLLYLYDILNEKTDDEHTLTVVEIQEELHRRGATAERKALYTDIELLYDAGVDVITEKSNCNHYHIGCRKFQLSELRLLADAVSSSQFLTESKSKVLIEKLGTLTSQYERKELAHPICISSHSKSLNEKSYINISLIQEAINTNKKISFRYFDYDLDKKKVYRDGTRTASPYALVWNNDRYYVVAFYEKYGENLTNFRIDKMEKISILAKGEAKPLPSGVDLSAYKNAIFSMYSGTKERVTISASSDLVNTVLERFGMDITIRKVGDSAFQTTVDVIPEPPFYSWIFQFGGKMTITYPPHVKQEYRKMLEDVMNEEC